MSWRKSIVESRKAATGLPIVQLATVDTKKEPANRSMIFQNWVMPPEIPEEQALEGFPALLQLYTKFASNKVSDIVESCPTGEICWYFTQSDEQYRLKGEFFILISPSEIQKNATKNSVQQRLVTNIPQQPLNKSKKAVAMNWEQERLRGWNALPEFIRKTYKNGSDDFCTLIMKVNRVKHMCHGNHKELTFTWNDETWTWAQA